MVSLCLSARSRCVCLHGLVVSVCTVSLCLSARSRRVCLHGLAVSAWRGCVLLPLSAWFCFVCLHSLVSVCMAWLCLSTWCRCTVSEWSCVCLHGMAVAAWPRSVSAHGFTVSVRIVALCLSAWPLCVCVYAVTESAYMQASLCLHGLAVSVYICTWFCLLLHRTYRPRNRDLALNTNCVYLTIPMFFPAAKNTVYRLYAWRSVALNSMVSCH